MFLSKLKLTAGICGLALAATAGLWPASTPRAVAQPPAKPKPAAARPAPPREGVILLTSFGTEKPAELLTPAGVPLREPALGAADVPWRGWLSADAKRVLVLSPEREFPRDAAISPEAYAEVRRKAPWGRGSLHVFPLDGPGSTGPVLGDLGLAWAAWGPAGKIYGSRIDPAKMTARPAAGGPAPFVSFIYDPATNETTPLAVPPGYGVWDVSPAGRVLLARRMLEGSPRTGETYLIPLDTLKPRSVGRPGFIGLRLSPDGKRVIGFYATPKGEGQPPEQRVVVVSVADGTEAAVQLPDGAVSLAQACWSPDGKRIAFVWSEEVEPADDRPRPVQIGGGRAGVLASRVTVADPNGGNATTIVKRDSNQSIVSIDWK